MFAIKNREFVLLTIGISLYGDYYNYAHLIFTGEIFYGKEIFVSYKYADCQVENLSIYTNSTVRDYVTGFEEILEPSDNIYKGESDGEDLSALSVESIWRKLKDRIYDSSVTVVLPDQNGSYSYHLENRSCCGNGCITYHTDRLFSIISKNKFNIKEANKKMCDTGSSTWYGKCSYIEAVKWCDFINNYSSYINSACERQDNIDDYIIHKEV